MYKWIFTETVNLPGGWVHTTQIFEKVQDFATAREESAQDSGVSGFFTLRDCETISDSWYL